NGLLPLVAPSRRLLNLLSEVGVDGASNQLRARGSLGGGSLVERRGLLLVEIDLGAAVHGVQAYITGRRGRNRGVSGLLAKLWHVSLRVQAKEIRPPLPAGPFLVVGLARSGHAPARLLAARGVDVLAVESGQ